MARSLQVARDATTSVHGGTEKLAAKITEPLKSAFCLLSDYSTYRLSCPLIDVVNHVDHMRAVPYLAV